MSHVESFEDTLRANWVEVAANLHDESKVSEWYLAQVAQLLLILKHDLTLISEEGITDSPLFKCPLKYRINGICAILELVGCFKPEHASTLVDAHTNFVSKLKTYWARHYGDASYPINVDKYDRRSAQYLTFKYSILYDFYWDKLRHYARARIDLIDQAIQFIESPLIP